MENYIFISTLFFAVVTASKVIFEASPAELKTNLTDTAAMRCSVVDSSTANTFRASSTDVDVHRVVSLFVTTGTGQDVASVTSVDAPMAFVDLGNLHVKGSISAVSGEGYIELTWTDPSTISLGEYKCDVTAIDSRGHTVMLASGLEMSAVPPSIMDVIAAFKNEKTRQQQLITSLTQEITHLKKCTAPRVGFTMTFKSTGNAIHIANGQVAMYDKVIQNTDGAFDINTGTFTCQEPGMYSFHIYVLAYGSNNACLGLQLNGGTITNAHADNDDYNTASTGAVIALVQGDVVRVVACYDSYITQHVNGTWGFQSNIFTGQLSQGDQCLA